MDIKECVLLVFQFIGLYSLHGFYCLPTDIKIEVSCPTSKRLYTYCFVYFGHPLTSHSIPLCTVLHSTSGSPSTSRTELFAVSRQVFKPISKLLERWQLSKVYRLLADRKPIHLTPINTSFPAGRVGSRQY